jgi:diguanylate cyclase (GGDEF)-like protein
VAGGFAALSLILLLAHGIAPSLSSLSLAQVFVVTALILTWDGFRRFVGRTPLSSTALTTLAVSILAWLAVTTTGISLEIHATSNAILVTVLSALIARELLSMAKPDQPAMRATGWAYAANAVFFLARPIAGFIASEPASALNPDGIAAFPLLWWLCMTIAVTLGMVLMTSERLQSDLHHQANRDPLTGALNRRAFTLMADKEMSRARRNGKLFSVLMMDLDHFKRINDRLGHDGGDALLCQFVTTAEQILRGEDIFCRFGGEEFVALLPDTTAEQALVAAERLRTAFAKGSATMEPRSDLHPFTVSIGISELERSQDDDIESLLRRADVALYRAKDLGRNRCELAEAVPAEALYRGVPQNIPQGNS